MADFSKFCMEFPFDLSLELTSSDPIFEDGGQNPRWLPKKELSYIWIKCQKFTNEVRSSDKIQR